MVLAGYVPKILEVDQRSDPLLVVELDPVKLSKLKGTKRATAEHTAQPHAFEFRPQRYILRTPGYGEAEFAWTPELLADLERLRHPRCESEVKHRVGGLLRAFLSGAGWELHEEAIEQRRGGDAPIVVTIRSAAAELYALPWELLELGRSGLFLADIPGLLLRYDWPLVRAVEDRVPADERRGRVLFCRLVGIQV